VSMCVVGDDTNCLIPMPSHGLVRSAICPSGSGFGWRSVKPSRYATLVRTQHLPHQDHQALTRPFAKLIFLISRQVALGRRAVLRAVDPSSPTGFLLAIGGEAVPRPVRLCPAAPVGYGWSLPVRSQTDGWVSLRKRGRACRSGSGPT
jgi:hypothetical protein